MVHTGARKWAEFKSLIAHHNLVYFRRSTGAKANGDPTNLGPWLKSQKNSNEVNSMARTSNPMQFGIRIGGSPPFDRATAMAQAAESAGFSTLCFSDRPPDPGLEGWTFATAIGAQTKKLKITWGTLNVPFRNPGLTAQMASSLDFILGGGRVEMTLGTGGQQNSQQYTNYGLPFGDNGERFEA